jgi:uncharacterized protein (TIGR03083 family)
MGMARDERADLVELLTTLTPEEWDARTLCDQWRVRDVVAHMFSYEELTFTQMVPRSVRFLLAPERTNAMVLAAFGERGPDELLALASNHLRPKGLTAWFGGRIALTDGMIHHQDIRRPLGRPREIPAERMLTVLEFAKTAPPLRSKQRIRGLRLTATDLDWSTGNGPEVTGPAESLLMAIAGRPVTSELSGAGVAELEARIGNQAVAS